jgi:hypothetical protein
MEGSLVAYKVFTNGSVLNASEINENLMQQSTAVFSNAATRTAAIASPVEGQVTFLEDQNILSIYDGSAWKTSLAPTGSILQVVSAQTSTATSTTSTTGINTALSVNITPFSVSNKIVVQCYNENVQHFNGAGSSRINIRRDSTVLDAQVSVYLASTGSGLAVPASLAILDSPNTTSPTTYGTFLSTSSASNTSLVQGRQTIIVMEVAS